MSKLITYGEYCKLIDGIKYFHEEQTEIRFETSKILLGTFAVLGIVFFSGAAIPIFQPALLGIAIPVVASVLVSINMILDLIIRERLRLACFSEALIMEKDYNWLPQFHIRMESDGEIHGSGHKKFKFYLGCIAILSFVSAISWGLLYSFQGLWWILIAGAWGVYLLIYSLIALKYVKNAKEILKSLED